MLHVLNLSPSHFPISPSPLGSLDTSKSGANYLKRLGVSEFYPFKSVSRNHLITQEPLISCACSILLTF